MKLKRSRRSRRILSIYSRCFGLNSNELEIFVDYTFVKQALIHKINIRDSLAALNAGRFNLVTSDCIITECKSLGQLLSAPLTILQSYTLLKCHHTYNPLQGAVWCIRKRMRNAKKRSTNLSHLQQKKNYLFALASNDEELKVYARCVPGMPIYFISHRCINIEKIPYQTQNLINVYTCKSLQLNLYQEADIRAIGDKFGLDFESAPKVKKRKRKDPNPLSCKKKKLKASINVESQIESQKIKTRKRALKKTWAMLQFLQHIQNNSQTCLNRNYESH